MQANILYALVAVGAISAGTIGFANALTVGASAINPIGGNAGTVDSPTLGTITAVTWNEVTDGTGGNIEIGTADVTIDNGDFVSHDYELCILLSDGGSTESNLGCALATVPATSNLVVNIDFTPDFDTILATDLYITLEQLL